jgi:hypothetical protein
MPSVPQQYEHHFPNRITDIFDANLVLAYPPQFVTDPRCILLSQSHGYFRRERLQDYGSHAQLPF